MVYIAKKTGTLIATLFLISFLVFMAFQLIPGDPVTRILGTNYTPERAAELRAELDLDKPPLQRYFRWFRAFVGGDMGQSYNYSMKVSEMISGKFPVTLALSGMAFMLVVCISIPAGISLARFEGGFADRLFLVLNQVIMSTPAFFIGIVFCQLFGIRLKLFQTGGFVNISFADQPIKYLTYLIFPALAIALPRSAMAIKLLRGSILNEMKQDYIRTAYSHGNSRASALVFHALRNGIMPVIAFLAVTLSDIIAGSLVIEQVFDLPGIGRLLLNSIMGRDYPVVQALVIIIAAIVMFVNYLADVIYQYVDPRMRLN